MVKKDDKSIDLLQKCTDKPSQTQTKLIPENTTSAFEEIIKKHRMIKLVGHTCSIYSISIPVSL